MRHVGLDVHAKRSTFCVLDQYGRKLETRTIHGSWDKVVDALAKIKRPFSISFEATTGYGFLYDRLTQLGARVAVAHPGQVRLIFKAKIKNDRVDAKKLAQLVYLDAVPTVWVPSGDVRAWRSLIEHRQGLLGERTRAKNILRALLQTHGVSAPRGLWTQRGIAWLEALTWPTLLDAVKRDTLLERLASLDRMLRRVEAALDATATSHPGVRHLMDIPGVGKRTAEAVVAYIGDPHRFTKNRAIGNYFGLIPCQDSSAGKTRFGHITGDGPSTVRKLLVEAAWQGVRHCPTIRAVYERVRRGDPDRKKIAIVATAHYLARVMLAMLQTGEVWRATAA